MPPKIGSTFSTFSCVKYSSLAAASMVKDRSFITQLILEIQLQFQSITIAIVAALLQGSVGQLTKSQKYYH